MIYSLGALSPTIAEDVYVADSADVIGNVEIGAGSSVWFNTVLRADNDLIRIGTGSNIQDGTVIHVDEGVPTLIGNNVTVGHSTMIHGCTLEDGCLVGIGTTILDYAVVGTHSIVGANSLITERKTYPSRSLILGSPAKV
ncbi:MAG TPA: gamma carbonic anhydrase family protein, partial [Gammaproteobacteria bacterium]|nr:gamma carbonic anhydrase family protein [Gammaproteobacteria bacterium]